MDERYKKEPIKCDECHKQKPLYQIKDTELTDYGRGEQWLDLHVCKSCMEEKYGDTND